MNKLNLKYLERVKIKNTGSVTCKRYLKKSKQTCDDAEREQ